MASTSRKASQEKMSAYRRRLRAQGLRPIQIWVPDVRAPGFKAQAHRQSLAVAISPQANVDQSFIDDVSELRVDERPE
jgi:Antitoxin MazE-like